VPKNRIPSETVKLGRPLDLWVRKGNTVTHYMGSDLKGFQMLTTPDAEERRPGRARLFLVKPRAIKANGKIHRPGARTYEMWHKRNPKQGLELTGIAEGAPVLLGRADRLDYASDKWKPRGNHVGYTHSFLDGKPPLVYADRIRSPRAFVLVGGDMSITRRGIE
jgi:hypothetical protein